MFTKTEKGYLLLTLAFLAAGSGIKAYRHAAIRLGPFKEAIGKEAIGKEGIGSASHQASMAEEAVETPAASDSSLARPEAGSDSLDGADSVGGQALPSGANVGSRDGDSPSGVPDPGSAGPGSVKPPGSKKPARSGADKSAFAGKIDLNRAEASELTRLSGVGAKTAQAIIDYRRAHGPYRNFRDLLRIKGIGEKKLEKLMPNLIL